MQILDKENLLDIQLEVEEDRQKLEKLFVNQGQESFKTNFREILTKISLEIKKLDDFIEDEKNHKKTRYFINKILEYHDNIKKLEIYLCNLALDSKYLELTNLLLPKVAIRNIRIVFSVCYQATKKVTESNQINITETQLIYLINICSGILYSIKEQFISTNREELLKYSEYFTSVIIYLNHKISKIEDNINNKNKDFAIKPDIENQKDLISNAKKNLKSTLSILVDNLKDQDQDIVITISSISWEKYKYFTEFLGDISLCIPVYYNSNLELIIGNSKSTEIRVPGADKKRLIIPKSFDDPLPSDILDAFEGKI